MGDEPGKQTPPAPNPAPTPAPPAPEPTPGGDKFTPITSQEQLNGIIKGRIERAEKKAVEKFSDYDALKAKAEAYDALGKQFSGGEGDKGGGASTIEERVAALESENRALKHASELDAWKAEVSKTTGVPAAVLRGDTLEEIQAHADSIKAAMPVYPTVHEQGGSNPAPVTAADIMKERDVKKRHAMWAAHPELFK